MARDSIPYIQGISEDKDQGRRGDIDAIHGVSSDG
jgi:hypothetical protein